MFSRIILRACILSALCLYIGESQPTITKRVAELCSALQGNPIGKSPKDDPYDYYDQPPGRGPKGKKPKGTDPYADNVKPPGRGPNGKTPKDPVDDPYYDDDYYDDDEAPNKGNPKKKPTKKPTDDYYDDYDPEFDDDALGEGDPEDPDYPDARGSPTNPNSPKNKKPIPDLKVVVYCGGGKVARKM